MFAIENEEGIIYYLFTKTPRIQLYDCFSGKFARGSCYANYIIEALDYTDIILNRYSRLNASI